MALSLVVIVLVAEVMVVTWGRGAVRSALDEAVRAGARVSDAQGTCRQRAETALDDLLSGELRAGVAPVACADDGETVVARTTTAFPAWLPGMSPWTGAQAATAAREPLPP